MSDLKAALLGAIVGGALSIGGGYLQARLARDKDLESERRQKLEQLVEQSFKLNSCTLETIRTGLEASECENGHTIYRMLALGAMYFPNLDKPIADYVGRTMEVDSSATKCGHDYPGNDKAQARRQCLQEVLHAGLATQQFLALQQAVTNEMQPLR